MSPTQKDIDLLFLHDKRVRMKVILLDDNYQELEELTGRIKSSSYSISSDSDIRRTCNLIMIIDDKASINYNFEMTWIERMVELSCGIWDSSIGDYIWYKLGRMLMIDGSSSFSATTQEVRLSLVDLMASMTDGRGSQLGSQVLIPAGTPIKNAFEATVAEYSPYKRTNVSEFPDTVPYDITSNIGDYPHSILKTLINLFPYYEMFYDVDGIYVVREIPTKIEDPVDIPADIIDKAILSHNSEQRGVQFSMVKNTVEIWGRSLDAMYTASTCLSDGTKYDIFIDDSFDALVVGETYSFTPDKTSSSGQTLKIQDTSEYQIYTQAGDGTYTPIEDGAMTAGIPYVIMYTDDHFVLQGELEIHVIAQEVKADPSVTAKVDYKQKNACRDVKWIVNPDSPFACVETPTTHRIDRETKIVLEGGEYSNIHTTALALERASYELWLRTRLQDSVTLEMLYMPWMEVNDKIEYTSPSSGEKVQLIVQGIDPDFKNWTMSVKATKFYPVYPW